MHIDLSALNFDFLVSLPTLHEGHVSNTKIKSDNMRLSLTRTGNPNFRQAFIELYDGQSWVTFVTVTEKLIGKRWVQVDEAIL